MRGDGDLEDSLHIAKSLDEPVPGHHAGGVENEHNFEVQAWEPKYPQKKVWKL